MQLIETKTLGTAQSSIVFSDIPQTFTDLYVVISARSARTAVDDDLVLSFNSNTSNYTIRRLFGTGSGKGSITTPVRFAGYLNGNSTTSNSFASASLYIPNYTSSAAKSYSVDSATENNATESYQDISAGLWNDTSAITSITFTSNRSQNLLADSTISLYGIGPNTSNAGAKATGGIIQRVGDYFVHTFTSSGTFTPTTNLTNVEYVVVAGGGNASRGAGGVGSGGGGGGGFRSSVVGELSGGGASPESRLSLTSGVGYTVTVGAGGNNSSFDTITSLAGGYTATNGGSGGGGNQSGYAGPGSGTTGQGYGGGSGSSSSFSGAGGGGAGAIGGSTSGFYGGQGGKGQTTAISGAGITYGGGGGGSGFDGGGGGGLGGGGNGGTSSGAQDGAVNSGGGAGAGRSAAADKSGGSGIVIVRYAA